MGSADALPATYALSAKVGPHAWRIFRGHKGFGWIFRRLPATQGRTAPVESRGHGRIAGRRGMMSWRLHAPALEAQLWRHPR
jgi:hypothetical protein